MDEISSGEAHCDKLLGCYRSKTDHAISAAVRKAEEHMFVSSQKRGH
uniref:Uncharacterized protein n=1 Tax=Caenorhabditis japonica TaxID=281687 RepID=A0A8R1IY35_CAEJA